MMRKLLAIAGAFLILALPRVCAQQSGGVLRITHRDSPGSMSIHEEGTISVVLPMMGVFNNLVLFDQHTPQNSLDRIVPDLATSWTWSEGGKKLTFTLRKGVVWHDGKPFTAADVKCTWDLLADATTETLRVNFRKGWYSNVEGVTVNGDYEAVFNLKMPQPGILSLLASGFTPVYPCHVSPRDMRRSPIGTGPFKFVEYKGNQGIKVTQSELLEARPTAPGWHRIHDHSEPFDRDSGFCGRQFRHDLPL
jgi:peptide/nickel transport system substrate-binding protein